MMVVLLIRVPIITEAVSIASEVILIGSDADSMDVGSDSINTDATLFIMMQIRWIRMFIRVFPMSIRWAFDRLCSRFRSF